MLRLSTTIEQGLKLVELGLDRNTADMHYGVPDQDSTPVCMGRYADVIDSYYQLIPNRLNLIIPAWSITALQKLMPEHNIYKIKGKFSVDYWRDLWNYHYTDKYDEPIDAVFEMVCWLLEHNEMFLYNEQQGKEIQEDGKAS